MIWQAAAFVVTTTVWCCFGLLNINAHLLSVKNMFLMSSLPGVCVYAADGVLLERGALFGGMTASESTEEGGLNGMRSDRPTESPSLAWVRPPLMSRPAARSRPGCRTGGPTTVGDVPPPHTHIHVNPADVTGVQMKTWGHGGEQTEEKWMLFCCQRFSYLEPTHWDEWRMGTAPPPVPLL